VQLGIRLRTLWRLKLGLVAALVFAIVAATLSVQKISLSPFALTARNVEMATASTYVVVDTPTSALVDLRQDTYSVEGLRNRTVLLGNVIASSEVRQNIAKKAGIPVDVLRIQAPLTPEMSAPPVDSENARHTSDILKSTDQYRLNIQANPTVPMLDIYAQAPKAETAAIMANAAVDELRLYLGRLASTQRTPMAKQIRLLHLGKARGVVINPGVNRQVALLTFLITFGIACATVIFLSRVRDGWRLAARADRPASASS
jgi:hypothetical protein